MLAGDSGAFESLSVSTCTQIWYGLVPWRLGWQTIPQPRGVRYTFGASDAAARAYKSTPLLICRTHHNSEALSMTNPHQTDQDLALYLHPLTSFFGMLIQP